MVRWEDFKKRRPLVIIKYVEQKKFRMILKSLKVFGKVVFMLKTLYKAF